MEGDGKLAQAHIVFKNAGSRGRLTSSLLFGALLGCGGQRVGGSKLPCRSGPLAAGALGSCNLCCQPHRAAISAVNNGVSVATRWACP